MYLFELSIIRSNALSIDKRPPGFTVLVTQSITLLPLRHRLYKTQLRKYRSYELNISLKTILNIAVPTEGRHMI